MGSVMKTLLDKTMVRLTVCLVSIFLLCMPLFYYLTTRYYAEDLIDVVDDYKSGKQIDENIDLEEDVVIGMMIQYAMIAVVVGTSVLITMRFVTKKLWAPFDDTLRKIEGFHLGKDEAPTFKKTNVKEFSRLNHSLENLIARDISSYRVQKEFTENASHELQTPLAILRTDLDMLIQEDLNQRESELVDDMYDVLTRMERLNKSLLLLAKIENNQYEELEDVSVPDMIQDMIPSYGKLYDNNILYTQNGKLVVKTSRQLMEILLNNLIINALRNSDRYSSVMIHTDGHSFEVSNQSIRGPLNEEKLFSRFNNPTQSKTGHGLGLAIVKQVCDHYHWNIHYIYKEGSHTFRVTFA